MRIGTTVPSRRGATPAPTATQLTADHAFTGWTVHDRR
jgi:hypothetical protein